MIRILIICSVFLFACNSQDKTENVIDSNILCFSSFQFGGRTPDTVRHFPLFTCLFKIDSLIFLKTDRDYNWYFEKIKLSKTEIDTINKLIKAIDFEKCINKNMLQKMRDSLIMYCGSNYGLIDNQNNISVFIPYDDGENIRRLESVLYNINGVSTIDTLEIIDYSIKIKRKYLKEAGPFPVMEKVEFVAPIIKEDSVLNQN